MRPRSLTKKVTLQKVAAAAVPDAAGHIDLSQAANWDNVTDRYFSVLPQSGREFYRAQKTESNVTHVLETHYDDQTKLIDPSYRLNVTGTSRYLNVVSAMNVDETNRTIRVSCIEVT